MNENKPLITIRRADFDDCKGLNGLVESTGGVSIYKASFGQFNFSSVIENSVLSLVVTEGLQTESSIEENYVAFISVNDSNGINGDMQSFSSSVQLLKSYIPVNENNTLFINFWSVEEQANDVHDTGTNMINQLFANCPNVDFLVWCCPTNYMTTAFIDSTFSSINVNSNNEDKKGTLFKGCKVLFLHRSNFLPQLMVREARVEDNDDMIPILRKFNPDILVGQESFFLADLIQAQDESNKFFVGLKRNTIVGMLATSLDVNASLITKLFDISAFSDIIVQEEQKPLPPPLVICIVGDLRLVDMAAVEDLVAGFDCVFVNAETLSSNNLASSTDRSWALKTHFDKLLLQRGSTQPLPSAFIVHGYPRTEAEAVEELQHVMFDSSHVVELFNTTEDAEEDEDDVFLQQHLDGLEVLREQYFSGDRAPAPGQVKAQWRKISIDSELRNKSENVSQLAQELTRVLDHRAMKIEAQRVKDNEEPPVANAFALTVFCLEEEFLSRAEDLLRLAFEEHPHHSYCLYMVPNNRPPSALTQAMTFVKTRQGLSFDQSLFIMHRSYFLAHEHLSVSRLTASSLTSLERFLAPMKAVERNTVLELAECAIKECDVELRDNPCEVTLLVQLGKVAVGVVQLSRKMVTSEDSNWFRANYRVDNLINFDRHRVRNQAAVTQWILDPIYSRWSRHILRDVLRQCGKSLLFYQTSDPSQPAPKEIAEDFVGLMPRSRMQQGPLCGPVALVVRPTRSAPGADCPLYCLTKYFLASPKATVAKRVVVVGGSSHAYALLETLFAVPYLTFPNVYLVMDRPPMPLRVGDGSTDSSAEESKLDDDYSGCLSPSEVDFPLEQELLALGLAHKVNLVRGRLTDIDRDNKAIVVSDEVAVEYDVLVLSSNTQDNSTSKFPSVASMHSAKCADAGIFELGNPSADLLALRWVRKRYNSRLEAVVVYGSVTRTFAAIARLLKSGIAPSRIVAVLQDAETYINEIEDAVVSDKLLEVVGAVGVKIYWEHLVADVALSRTGFLQYVDIRSKSGAYTAEFAAEQEGGESKGQYTETGDLRIPCIALLCCNQKQCDKDVFCAINDSGLVFDGGLVVDASFRTVDPCIYGVGDFTRFSRMYKDALPHARYNPREVGSYVALKLLASHLDPLSARLRSAVKPEYSLSEGSMVRSGHVLTASSQHKQQPLPVFTLPRTLYAEMPGGLYLFLSSLPKQPDEASYFSTPPPLDIRASLVPTASGATVSCCSLKCDHYGNVTEFVYLGSTRVEERNLRHIAGKHESMLNSAVHAHRKGFVVDWIAHFRADWAAVLYHDKFSSLLQALRDSLRSDKGMVMVLSRVFERAENSLDNLEVDDFRRGFVGPHGELLPEATAKTVHAETHSFLKTHKTTLPQYHVVLPNEGNNANNH